MEFQLSREEKIRNVNSVILMKENELFHSLLMAGYDPETFDPSTFEVPEDEPLGSIEFRIGTTLADLSRHRAYLESL